MTKERVRGDLSEVSELIKSFQGGYTLRVGILGSKARAIHPNKRGSKGTKTNAEIGVFHEQPDGEGSKMPRRSFLLDSLVEKLNFNEQAMKKFKDVAFQKVFIQKDMKAFLQDLGSHALTIVEEGFATNGFGNWKPLSSAYWNKKVGRIKSWRKRQEYEFNHPILTLTGKLRHSISFKVLKNDTIGKK